MKRLTLLLLILFLPFISAYQIKVTSNHPFLVNDSWIEASELKVGDYLTSIDGRKVRITSIQDIQETKEVFNFETSFHNYVVSPFDIVVHNSNRDSIRDVIGSYYYISNFFGRNLDLTLEEGKNFELIMEKMIKKVASYEEIKYASEITQKIFKQWGVEYSMITFTKFLIFPSETTPLNRLAKILSKYKFQGKGIELTVDLQNSAYGTFEDNPISISLRPLKALQTDSIDSTLFHELNHFYSFYNFYSTKRTSLEGLIKLISFSSETSLSFAPESYNKWMLADEEYAFWISFLLDYKNSLSRFNSLKKINPNLAKAELSKISMDISINYRLNRICQSKLLILKNLEQEMQASLNTPYSYKLDFGEYITSIDKINLRAGNTYHDVLFFSTTKNGKSFWKLEITSNLGETITFVIDDPYVATEILKITKSSTSQEEKNKKITELLVYAVEPQINLAIKSAKHTLVALNVIQNEAIGMTDICDNRIEAIENFILKTNLRNGYVPRKNFVDLSEYYELGDNDLTIKDVIK